MRRLGWSALAAAWAGLLIWLGTRHGEGLPSAWPGVDKLAHAGAYGVLGFLVARATGARTTWLPALAGLFWGMLDEWLQASVPGRSSDAFDVAADVVGAFLGGWIAIRTAPRGSR